MFSNIYKSVEARLKIATPFEISIVLVLCMVATVTVYTLYTKETLDPGGGIFTPPVTPEIIMHTDPTKESTFEEKRQELERIEADIVLSDTEIERLSYMLQKAFGLVVAHNRSETRDGAPLQEARTLFGEVYEKTKNSPTYGQMNELALWGYLFQFVSTVYDTRIVDGMPADIKNVYFTYFNNPESVNGTTEEQHRKVLEGMIALVDNAELFSFLKNDKSFNAYSASVKAAYLDSYREQLTTSEVASVSASLTDDINAYAQGKEKIEESGGNSLRSTSINPMHIAYAEYVRAYSESGEIPDTTGFESVYKTIESLSGVDAFGRSIILFRIGLYQLSALVREGASEEVIASRVAILKTVATSREGLNIITRNILTERLEDGAEWNRVHRDLAVLAETSPSFQDLLNTLGVTR